MESGDVGWKLPMRHADCELPPPTLCDHPLVLNQGPQRKTEAAFPERPLATIAMLLYIDPRTFTRDCIGRWLQSHLIGFEVRAVPDLEQAAAAIAESEPRTMIINTSPERMSSSTTSSLIMRLREMLPSVPVAVLSDYEDPENIRSAFDQGVSGYIPTSLTSPVAAQAIHLISAGGTFAPSAALLAPSKARDAAQGVPAGFTQRQAEILACLRRGLANKLIAYELSMCESTVKVHIRNIMKKLKATNRTEVVYFTNDLFVGGVQCRR